MQPAITALRDSVVTTYLGTTECLQSAARLAAGALLPAWMQPQAYDPQHFTGKVG